MQIQFIGSGKIVRKFLDPINNQNFGKFLANSHGNEKFHLAKIDFYFYNQINSFKRFQSKPL
jgi:hypothetical protein